MTNLPVSRRSSVNKPLAFILPTLALLVAGFAPAARAQGRLADRISGGIDNSSRATLAGSMPPRAKASTDLGSVPGDTRLTGMMLAFSRTPAQQADLATLMAAQQDPASPLFHQWLTPAQFGARFGVSDNDLAATESWLQSQGFTIDAVSPSRTSITFEGTESSVESAFGAPLHYFRGRTDTTTHIAPAHDISLPASLSSVVLGVAGLSNYRPHANSKLRTDFTSVQSGSHYLTPGDIATIYDITTPYGNGYAGSGQTIVVAGQSSVSLADIAAFQSAAGVPTNTPILTLVPNTGSAAVDYYSVGDEAESDLDLEYSSSIAYKATVDFVYVGNSSSLGVTQSMIYAVENDLGNIITVSYGECESELGSYYYNLFEGYFQQGAAQGQTIISSSGDSGSTGCSGFSNLTTSQQEAVVVQYPASSAYVTAVGGTEFPSADTASSNSTYFTAASNADVIASAKSYIPEQAWNDDSSSVGLSSGGGGVSVYTQRPSWQAAGTLVGGAGIPAGSYRLVPDVALDSSPYNAGYLYCSSDYNATGITGSCTNGFRASNGSSLTLAGGTSFAAPIFAGMVAIINQAKGYNTGQGLVNPTLYSLAENNATYASAFHDITSGSNACTAGSSYPTDPGSSDNYYLACTSPATSDYSAVTGYDEATGLGSVDLGKLISAYPVSQSSLLGSTTTVTPNSTTPALNANDTFAIVVSAKTGSGTPTGSVAITDNGTTVTNSPFALSGGAYIYTYNSSKAGVHQLVFTYSGDSTYARSKSTQIINVGNAGFTVTATSPTITAGNSGTFTVTVTPTNGYTGTVVLSFGGTGATSGGTEIVDTCTSPSILGTNSVTIPSGTTAAVSQTFTVYTSSTSCGTNGLTTFVKPALKAANTLPVAPAPRPSPWRNAPAPVALAGLLLVGCFKRRSKLLRAGVTLGIMLVLGLSGLGLSGCSNSSSTAGSTQVNASTGTYNFNVYGTDTLDSAITTSTSPTAFTITIQ